MINSDVCESVTVAQEDEDQTAYPVQLPENIRIGMGGRKSTNIAHFYIGDDNFRKGVCLCGRTVKPILEFEHWNLEEALIQESTCSDCLKRVKLYQYLKLKRI